MSFFDDEYDLFDDFSLLEEDYENVVGDEVKEAKSLLLNSTDIPYSITVTNTTAGTLNLVLFGSQQYLLSPNYGSAAGLVVTPSQSNITYLQLLQQSAIKPFKTKLSRVQSTNRNQINQIVNINVVDADGNSCLTPLVMQDYFSAYQSQRGVLDVPYEFSIDDQTSITTQVLSNTTVTYTFYPYLLDEKTDEKAEDKDIQKVQFTLTNNTTSAVSIDLFNTDTLIQQPTSNSFVPPTSFTYSTSIVNSIRGVTVIANGNYFLSITGANSLEVYSSSNALITSILLPIGSQPYLAAYNLTNNSLYVTDFTNAQVFVINCATNTLTTTITGFANDLRAISFSPLSNQMYVATVNFSFPIQIIDCATNTIIASPSTPACQPQSITYNFLQNQMYVVLTGANAIGIFDCDTNTLIATISLSFNPQNIVYCSTNNCVYVTYSVNNIISLISCATNTFVQNITYGGLASTITSSVFVSQMNLLYFSDSTNGFIYQVDPTTNMITNSLIIPTNPFSYIDYSLTTTTLISVVNGAISVVNGFAGSIIPTYITSSTNYNFFVQNLESQPIKLDCIKFVGLQNQLKNVINVYKIDANGISSTEPYFPINNLSVDQRQGNIAYVDFKGMVLDGRTFFEQYNIQPLQSITMIMCYRQPKIQCGNVLNAILRPTKRLKETDDLKIDTDVAKTYPLFVDSQRKKTFFKTKI